MSKIARRALLVADILAVFIVHYALVSAAIMIVVIFG